MRSRVLAVLLAAAILVVAGPFARAATGDPNDPLYPETDTSLGQWGLRQINAPAAWSTTTGTGAVIAIVDTGVDLGHVDLAANVLPGRSFNRDEGCDDPDGCGDGSFGESESDPSGPAHGSHVAGIAAAETDNGIGIAGVAPDAKILPINVFSDDPVQGFGAFSEDVGHGIDWAVDNGADVINLSLGSLPVLGQALDLFGDPIVGAIADANEAGVVVVAAAGNEAFPLCDSPAWSEGVLCVGATDWLDKAAEYSNFPVKPDRYAVRAPGGGTDGIVLCGGGVVSTVPDGFDNCDLDGGQGAYADNVGTSMASPHAAGVAALVRTLGCNREQTLDIITSTAVNPVTGESGTYDPVYGYGIVDAAAAAQAAQDTCSGSTTTTAGEPPKSDRRKRPHK